MPRYLTLINFTEQGAQAIKQSPKRASVFRKMAESAGAKVQGLYWSLGKYDGAIVLDAPDDETATALLCSLAKAGNVRTRTQRLYDEKEFSAIAGKIR